MSCDRIQDLLAAYSENDLSAEDQSAVESHCLSCPDCASLLAMLKVADEALAAFPEVAPSSALLGRLSEIPVQKRRSRPSLGFFLRPSLQPIFAALTILVTLISLYFFNPNRKAFDKAVNIQFHRGLSQIERLYAKAGAVTDTLGAYANNVFVALKALNPLGQNKD